MVGMGAAGSLVNYEELARGRPASLKVELAAVHRGVLMTNLPLQLRGGLLLQPENKSPFSEDSTCHKVNFFKREARTKKERLKGS